MTASTQKFPRDTTRLLAATATEVVELADGDRYTLRIAPVTKRIGDATVRMLGDLEATVHWHGAAAREPLRRHPRDPGAHANRRALHGARRVSRPGHVLVSPTHPRGLRAGDGPLRQLHRRPGRPRLLIARFIPSSLSPWTTSSSKTGRLRRSAPTKRPTRRWVASATCCSSPASRSSPSRLKSPGHLTLEHRTPGRTYTHADITVAEDRATPSLADSFAALRTAPELIAERKRLIPLVDAPPDKPFAFVAEMDMGEPDVGAGEALVYTCPMHPDVGIVLDVTNVGLDGALPHRRAP